MPSRPGPAGVKPTLIGPGDQRCSRRQHIEAHDDFLRKALRWGSIDRFDTGEGLPNRVIPAFIARTLFPFITETLAGRRDGHLRFRAVRDVLAIAGSLPFGA